MAVSRRLRVRAVMPRTRSSSSRKAITSGASMSSSASADGALRRRLLHELQQHLERVAVRGDRVCAGLALLHQPLGEEALQQNTAKLGWPLMATSPQRRSSRDHRLRHQLRPGAQVPVGAGHVDVAEVGRQHRHLARRVLARLVPPRQRLDREAMPEVVQPRSLARADRAQARAARQRVEGSMNVAAVEPVAAARDEHVGGDRVTEELLRAARGSRPGPRRWTDGSARAATGRAWHRGSSRPPVQDPRRRARRFSASEMRRPVTLSRPSRQWNTQGRSGVDGQAIGSCSAASSSRLISSSVYR